MEMIRLSGTKLDQITLLQSIGFHKKDAVRTAEALAAILPPKEISPAPKEVRPLPEI